MSNKGAILFLAVFGLLPKGQAEPQDVATDARHYSLPGVIADETLLGKWEVISAGFLWDVRTSWAMLTVKNVGREQESATRFYAEYFDANKRMCFSAAFVLSANDEQANRPVLRGERRHLSLSLPGLGPAILPVDVRVYGIDEGTVRIQFPIISPITVLPWEPPNTEELISKVIGDDISVGVVSVALAEVVVEIDGRVSHARLVQTRHPASDEILRFIRLLRFSPQRKGERRQSATSLVLLRLRGEGTANFKEPFSRDDPWVENTFAVSGHGSCPLSMS